MKTKKIQLIHKEPNQECFEIFKSTIVEDKQLKRYEINEHTLIENLPENVINSFLDFLSGFSLRHKAVILEEIKKGNISLECADDNE
ncbi:MAG: hypothetical protein ACOC2U_02090 [bacterium]